MQPDGSMTSRSRDFAGRNRDAYRRRPARRPEAAAILRARRRAWSSCLRPSAASCRSRAHRRTQGARRGSGVSAGDRAGGDLALGRWRAREISAAQRPAEPWGRRIPVDRTPDRVRVEYGAPWSKAITQAPSETLKQILVRHNRLLPRLAPFSGRSSGIRPPCRRLGLSLRYSSACPGCIRGFCPWRRFIRCECRGSAGNRLDLDSRSVSW